MIYGEAGTGKPATAIEICRDLERAGRKGQIVCSTGVACDIYKVINNLGASRPATVNSFLGIYTAEAPFNNLVAKSLNNEYATIFETDTVIWDEISMSSKRTLELFHSISSLIRASTKPFGGLQMIIVGDWLQLKPVPGSFDDGY